ncbi:hypothetical protein HK102_003760 [Quaeritorhiza haematococci]|nr:hypothetical protein HK102_003760 [Quaeritorhiza haematococci]
MTADSISVGLEILSTENANTVAAVAQQTGYSYAVVPLVRPNYDRLLVGSSSSSVDLKGSEGRNGDGDVVMKGMAAGQQVQPVENAGEPFFPVDVVVDNTDNITFLVGAISTHLELDSPDQTIRRNSEILLKQECQWAGYLGFSTVLFPPPPLAVRKQPSGHDDASAAPASLCVNYARCLNTMLEQLAFAQCWVRIPLSRPDAWQQWNMIRMLCDHNPRLGIALDLRDASVPAPGPLLDRWLAEPIRAVFMPRETFLTNAKGYPVLPKKHQAFVRSMIERGFNQFVVTITTPTDTHPSGGVQAYQQYLHHLQKTMPEPDVIEKFSTGYHDYLQAPLQPLMDNLESATYEVFEKDPIKYREYERAIRRALEDRVPANSDRVTVIMVVGAGRGPLVERALRAAEAAQRKVRCYAVEKNPNAVVILRSRKAREWGDKVQVVHSDMRYWDAPEKADILVSELLGSFGDNELSPECLDGAQKFLKDEGISIPSSYTAYAAPLSSHKLYNEVVSFKDLAHMETPYVVKFRNAHVLSEPAPLWTFDHPNRDPHAEIRPGTPTFNQHNTRFAHVTFRVAPPSNLNNSKASEGAATGDNSDAVADTAEAGAGDASYVMHGLAGYFEATLYKEVMISIHPRTHSPDMFSWFPIFFPIRMPIYLPANSLVDVCFWRVSDASKVWYEWSVIPRIQHQHQRIARPLSSSSSAQQQQVKSSVSYAKAMKGGSSPANVDGRVEEQKVEVAAGVPEAIIGNTSVLHNPGGRSYWIGLTS